MHHGGRGTGYDVRPATWKVVLASICVGVGKMDKGKITASDTLLENLRQTGWMALV